MTGGAGVVGSHLVRELVKRGDRPLVLDTRAGPRFLAEFGGRADFVTADVTELAPLIDLFRHLRVEAVAHLAALTGSRAPDQPMVQFRVNMEGTMNILEAARLAGVRRVIMASTRTVYPDFEGVAVRPAGVPTGARGSPPLPRPPLRDLEAGRRADRASLPGALRYRICRLPLRALLRRRVGRAGPLGWPAGHGPGPRADPPRPPARSRRRSPGGPTDPWT